MYTFTNAGGDFARHFNTAADGYEVNVFRRALKKQIAHAPANSITFAAERVSCQSYFTVYVCSDSFCYVMHVG